MKLSLVVRSPGKSEGKLIPITLTQFVIGRDPQCHLRPASAAISKRHCALLVRGDKAFVRDFDSTNGTFINDEQIQGERELHNDDKLKVGPLLFDVKLEPSVTGATPPPAVKAVDVGAAKSADAQDDEAVAAMLLALQDDPTTPGSAGLDSQGIPTGSTVMDILSVPTEGTKEEETAKPGAKKADAAKAATGNTSSAAKAILEKYMRRPRT
jgi:pSer/pThr/pTyr-binding forkhead associated (FHA) protein